MGNVIPSMAIKAYENANGDLAKVYSEYIRLYYKCTGRLAPGCDAKDVIKYIQGNVNGVLREVHEEGPIEDAPGQAFMFEIEEDEKK